MFRPLVPHTQLNEQRSRGSLEAKAALQHGGLSGGGFGRQVNNHQTLKLLQQLIRHGVARSLGVLPRHLEPVERLVHLHHLLVESAHARHRSMDTNRKTQYGLMLTYGVNMRNIRYATFLWGM